MVIGQWKTGNILSIIRLYAVTMNENMTCKYADRIIVLNKRDYELVNINYKRSADLLLPISLKDTVLSGKIKKENRHLEKGLFVGSFFLVMFRVWNYLFVKYCRMLICNWWW